MQPKFLSKRIDIWVKGTVRPMGFELQEDCFQTFAARLGLDRLARRLAIQCGQLHIRPCLRSAVGNQYL